MRNRSVLRPVFVFGLCISALRAEFRIQGLTGNVAPQNSRFGFVSMSPFRSVKPEASHQM
ncbi:MAG: hypothetical protein JWN70_89 [Planctomycetaceae bacterium]|nr:hypothetical protein [Planctomycetaceae bacterium]